MATGNGEVGTEMPASLLSLPGIQRSQCPNSLAKAESFLFLTTYRFICLFGYARS